MSKPNYKLQLKNALARMSAGITLISSTTPLTRVQDKTLGVNRGIMYAYLKAVKYLEDGHTDKAYELLANIPYYLMGPHMEATDKEYVGTDASYKAFSTIRFLIRMQGLEEGTTKVGQGKIWNNVIVLG